MGCPLLSKSVSNVSTCFDWGIGLRWADFSESLHLLCQSDKILGLTTETQQIPAFSPMATTHFVLAAKLRSGPCDACCSTAAVFSFLLFHSTGTLSFPASMETTFFGSWGNVVRSCLPISSCASEYLFPSGVGRYLRSAFPLSPPPFHMPFTVPTACSASPFACGNNGLLVTWSNPYSVAKALKRTELYWAPLTDTNCFWDAMSTEHLFQSGYDCTRGRYFKSCHLNVLRKIINDKQIALLLPEEQISTNTLPWSFWNGRWQQWLTPRISVLSTDATLFHQLADMYWHTRQPHQLTSLGPAFYNPLVALRKNLQHLLPHRTGYDNSLSSQKEVSNYGKMPSLLPIWPQVFLQVTFFWPPQLAVLAVLADPQTESAFCSSTICFSLVSVAGKPCTTESMNTFRSASCSISSSESVCLIDALDSTSAVISCFPGTWIMS